MVNDNDEKNENPEESEYHFSDDEINFEDDIDSPKPATAVTESKGNIFTRLSSSKRMIITLVVFLILVFIVYKMVAPSSSTAINTDIAPVTSSQMQNNSPQNMQPMPAAVTTTTVTKTPVAPTMSVAVTPVQSIQKVAPTATTTTVSLPPPGGVVEPQVTYTQTTSTAPTSQPSTTVTTTGPQMPAVIPVTSSQPYSYPTPSVQVIATEGKLANLSAQTNAVVAQLDANYNQKLNEYNLQNKALQDRVDALAAKVGLMETQFNQLIQVLTRNPPVNETPPTPKASEDKIPYTVQAIIPGRAWLKSNNGETLTITEGDMIKEVGRVTKIDPYDGIVEINTGTKVISLSYGDGS